MKVSSLLKALFVMAAMETRFRAFANNVDVEQNSQESEHVIGHDSLNNKENILNIQDDFSVYENFQILTQEKTVYVTLSPTTIYVTVTKTVGTTTTVYPNTHIPIVLNSPVVSTEAPTPTKKIVSSSVFVVTTETAVVTSLTTTTAIQVPPTVSPTTTTAPTSTDKEEPVPSNDFATTRGELDMILGDRQKYMELLNNTTTAAEAVKTVESPVHESSAPVYGSVFSVLSQKEPESTTEYVPVSTPVLTTPLTSAVPPLSTEPFSTEISSAPASASLIPTSSSHFPVKSSLVNRNVTGPTTSADTNQQNATGLEQLLKNFSPYTDLPSADYEFSNGGSGIKAFTVLQGIVTVMAALVGATM